MQRQDGLEDLQDGVCYINEIYLGSLLLELPMLSTSELAQDVADTIERRGQEAGATRPDPMLPRVWGCGERVKARTAYSTSQPTATSESSSQTPRSSFLFSSSLQCNEPYGSIVSS
jgi:hypothetical protein